MPTLPRGMIDKVSEGAHTGEVCDDWFRSYSFVKSWELRQRTPRRGAPARPANLPIDKSLTLQRRSAE
jgi:hypothetical protein